MNDHLDPPRTGPFTFVLFKQLSTWSRSREGAQWISAQPAEKRLVCTEVLHQTTDKSLVSPESCETTATYRTTSTLTISLARQWMNICSTISTGGSLKRNIEADIVLGRERYWRMWSESSGEWPDWCQDPRRSKIDGIPGGRRVGGPDFNDASTIHRATVPTRQAHPQYQGKENQKTRREKSRKLEISLIRITWTMPRFPNIPLRYRSSIITNTALSPTP